MLQIVLFDHDDMDAAGCRIVFTIAHSHLKEGEDYLIVHCSNNNVDDLVTKTVMRDDVDVNTEIYFSDICASREVLEVLVEKFSTVKIWDHHRTNFFATWVVPDAKIIPENAIGVLESGTSIIFQHFAEIAANHPNDPRARYFLTPEARTQSILSNKINPDAPVIPEGGNLKLLSELVENIRSYDTYDWKESNNLTAKKLQTLFFLLGMNRFCNRYINRIMNSTSTGVIDDNDLEFVEARLENEQRIIDSIGVDNVYDVSIKGLRAAFILSSTGANISELSHQFLTKHKEFDMFIGFSFFKGGEYSFRCIREDLDLGKDIAASIGGGGHPKASGAPIPIEVRNQIIELLMTTIDENCEICEK